MPDPGPPPIGIAQRAAFALLTLVLFALGLELALAVVGAGDPRARLSLTRGFSNAARYLVPDPQRPGGLMTQMYGGETPEIRIPPKGPRVRVVMLGGSNVEGFPTTYISQQVNASLPAPGFEIINLGRRGYGSERERILLRQALELEPDIVLIYAGHNEYVEAGFAVELARQWPVAGVPALVESLSGLRTMNAALALAEALRPAPNAGVPEPEQHRGHELLDQGPEKAVIFQEVFRSNLRAMVGRARDAGARVLLATVVWNDFEPPFGTALPADAPLGTDEELARLRGEALGLIPARFRPGVIQTSRDEPALHLQPTDWGDATPADVLARRRAANAGRVAPPLRPISGAFAGNTFIPALDIVHDGVPLVLGTIGQIVERRLTAEERSGLARAAALFEEALRLVPDHPITLFDQGLVHYLLADDARAARLLRAASAADRAPGHANDPINDATRAVARERAGDAGLRFVDVDDFVRAAMPQGLVGYELMQDGCHLHRAARPALVTLLLPDLVELGRQVAAER